MTDAQHKEEGGRAGAAGWGVEHVFPQCILRLFLYLTLPLASQCTNDLLWPMKSEQRPCL